MIPPVPRRIMAFDLTLARDLSQALRAEQPESGLARSWAEKLRRFVEVNRVDLLSVAKKRFGAVQANPMIASMADVLAAAAVGGAHLDLVYFNAALWALDAAGAGSVRDASAPGSFANATVKDVFAKLRGGPPARDGAGSEIPWIGDEIQTSGNSDPFGVVVLCPQPRSLYTLSTLALLKRESIPVRAIIVRKLGWSRFVQEFRSDGLRLVWKIWRKLVLQSSENPGDPSQTLAGLAAELGVQKTTVPNYAREAGIPCHFALDFNGDDTREILKSCRPSCVVFTGGGLISDLTLERAGLGVINCHMGILPHYKGMDVVEWPLLQGAPQLVGATTHFMARGVDTGPILSGFKVDVTRHPTIGSIRNEVERRMPSLMRDTVKGLRDKALVPRAQPDAGRQYFRMHPKLEALLPIMLNHASGPKENSQ